jgi:hypothetical protein
VQRGPCPIRLEACFVPANNSLRLDEDQVPVSIPARASARLPRQFFRSGKARLRMHLLQNGELLAQCQVSMSRSRREQQDRTIRSNRSLSERSMSQW